MSRVCWDACRVFWKGSRVRVRQVLCSVQTHLTVHQLAPKWRRSLSRRPPQVARHAPERPAPCSQWRSVKQQCSSWSLFKQPDTVFWLSRTAAVCHASDYRRLRENGASFLISCPVCVNIFKRWQVILDPDWRSRRQTLLFCFDDEGNEASAHVRWRADMWINFRQLTASFDRLPPETGQCGKWKWGGT